MKPYRVDTNAEGNHVYIDDQNEATRHGGFAQAVFKMEDDKVLPDDLGRVLFSQELWARIGPMLAAPVMLQALEAAQRWHLGDAWRHSTSPREKDAWGLHAEMLRNALAVANAPVPWIKLDTTEQTGEKK